MTVGLKGEFIGFKSLKSLENTLRTSGELRAQTAEELTSFMERKKRRMDREERRRRHRRKELEHLRKFPTAHKLRSVARYNHSQALNNRLRLISDDLASSSSSPTPKSTMQ